MEKNFIQDFVEQVSKDRAERLDMWLMGVLANYLTPTELKIVARHRKKGDAKSTLKLLKKKRIYMENIFDQKTNKSFFMVRKRQQTVAFKEF